MKYSGNSSFAHDGSQRVGVLLVNHGSPRQPTAQHVRPYLRRFLSDPRLVEVPRAIWFFVLNAIILVIRPRRSARAYRSIWTDAGSPMDVLSHRLRDKISHRLVSLYGDRVTAELGMTYGSPSIAEALDRLRAAGAQQIVVLPLYPQYSATTVGSVFDRVATTLKTWRWVPELRFVTDYADHPAYIDALTESLETHWSMNGRPDRLLFSFHGIPQAYADAGDPYYCYCHKTARIVAERLHLAEDDWSLGFQSRFGPSQWLGPYTEDVLRDWRDEGRGNVDIVCPGFAVDCLETLEEIADRLRSAHEREGGRLRVVPCLNDSDAHAAALTELLRTHMQGWEKTLRPVSAVPNDRRSLRRRGTAA